MISSNILKISVLLVGYNIPSLTYYVENDKEINIGDIVEVPFKKRNKFGIVTAKNIETTISDDKIKSINRKIFNINISSKQIEFIEKAANYYLGAASSFLKMTIPISKILPLTENSSALPLNVNLATLNIEQQNAYQQIKEFTPPYKYNAVVLDGITGSGKTEVYFNVINDHLQNSNQQILILLPEIVLTNQLIDKFEKRFNFTPILWNSSLTETTKNKAWVEIITGKARVIIGTRSALFLPFKNLSLIIVEEESDSSYKQEDGVLYHARDMAILKAYIEKIAIILVSATPSIETMENVNNGKFHCVKLASRYFKLSLPHVIVVDLKKENLNKGEWLSKSLKDNILETLEANKQVLLFLNRRGYAPLLLCKNCGYRFCCDNCTTWLVEHKSKKRLECHHCGYVKAIPKICPDCKCDDSLISWGPGIERIAEEVNKLVPQSKIIIITKDTVKTAKDAKNLLDQILNEQVNIIIGTQLIAKGHHFPNLALVGVIDADIALKGGDLRAAEKTFQLLEQVRGRAGRENIVGKTILQTYYPNNEIIKAIAQNDRDKFYLKETEIRKESEMPPFSRLTAIIVSGLNEEKVKKAAKEIVKYAPRFNAITILGPVPSYLYKIRRKTRYRILVHAPKNFNIQNYLNLWFNNIKVAPSIRVKIDIDPYNFL